MVSDICDICKLILGDLSGSSVGFDHAWSLEWRCHLSTISYWTRGLSLKCNATSIDCLEVGAKYGVEMFTLFYSLRPSQAVSWAQVWANSSCSNGLLGCCWEVLCSVASSRGCTQWKCNMMPEAGFSALTFHEIKVCWNIQRVPEVLFE